MISKGYTTDVPYSPEVGRWLEAWVYQSDRIPVPVSFFDEADGPVVIGHIVPIRWWRNTVRREGKPNVEIAVVHFNVKHVLSPKKRMGDFCGSNYRVAFEVLKGIVVSAEVEKQ